MFRHLWIAQLPFTLVALVILVSQGQLASAEEVSAELPFKAYVSGHGFVNGSFISEPSNKTLSSDGGITQVLPYPGFGGVGGGGGIALGVNWKALSVDLGFDYSSDQAEGRINGQTLTMSQTTHHIPLTVRVSVPQAKWVKPSLFGGINWVSRSGSKMDAPPFTPPLLSPQDDSYTAWRFGLGFDIYLTDAWSIPFRILANYAPIDGDSLDERVELVRNESNALTGIRYTGQWEWQPQITLGLTYDFAHF